MYNKPKNLINFPSIKLSVEVRWFKLRRELTSSSREGPPDSLPILYVFDKQELRFQFVNENRPILMFPKTLSPEGKCLSTPDEVQLSLLLIFVLVNKNRTFNLENSPKTSAKNLHCVGG